MKSSIQKWQKGMSIVEIMITVVLGMVLLAGVIQVFLAQKQSYRFQQAITAIQENARAVVDTLNRDLRMAGHPHSDESFTAILSEGHVTVTTNGADNASDTLVIQQDREDRRDCLGQLIAASELRVINAYYIQNETLMCLGNGNTDAPQPIARGVSDFQVLYAIDTSSPRDFSTNRYVNADDVESFGGWQRVIGVRYALLFKSEGSETITASTEKFQLLDSKPQGPFNDRMIRRAVVSTVAFRNRL